MRTNRLYYISVLLSILASVASCRDENLDVADYTVAGEPVTVSVKVSVPEMQRHTRAAIDEYNLDYVQDLWVRAYSASTGKATGEALTLSPETHDTEGDGGGIHDILLKTQSGDNYIVAVANAAANRGFSSMDAAKTERPLAELLAEADTWEKFLSIVALAPSTEEQINHPSTPVPMAGCYLDLEAPGHGDPYNISQWQTDDFRSYFIPVSKSVQNLTGAIHLRRLVSNVKFCFKGGEGIDLKVNSYKVVNVPVYSWLYERGTIVQAGNELMLANYGDLAESEEDASNYYTEASFRGNLVRDGKYYGFEDGSVGFDFWMAENKHQGSDGCTSYTKREERVSKSSSLFSSLADAVATDARWTPNQMATYVVVSCTVAYEDEINVDEDGNIVEEGGASAHRTGVVQYLIHLGYIDGADEREKSKDFNSYRNADYTYNVTVNGINDIRVEAIKAGNYPGEGGLVTDLVNKQIELDAHYNAFNVRITEEERQSSGFGFTIMTCRNGLEYTFNEVNFKQDGTLKGGPYSSEEDKELYNWIEIRPTSAEYVLSEYKPRSGDYADGKTFLLSQIRNIPEGAISESGWYTIFVNEYTYEPMYDANNIDNNYGNETNSRWREYVNQNPRRFFIKTTRKVSEDGKSIYNRSKYGVVQYSMQTYYSGSGVGSGSATAIGVERINETEGLNMRRSYLTEINKRSNGRLNVAYWLGDGSLIINHNDYYRVMWDNFVSRRSPQMIGAVTGVRAQNGPELPDRTRSGDVVKLPALAPFNGIASSKFSDPQDGVTSGDNPQFVEGVNACMNRNRDNNGDGIIDPRELRWYVPAMGEYLRVIIGSESLDQPLLNFRSVSGIPRKKVGVDAWAQSEDSYYEVKNDYASRYMFIASNEYEVLWAMEGTSTSSWGNVLSWSGGYSYPWQVRCVRNLGTDLTTVKDEDNSGVSPAYEVVGNVVNMKYYDVSSIRGNRYSGNGKGTGLMPVHLNTDIHNVVCRRFEFDTEDIIIDENYRNAEKLKDYIEGNPCGERNSATGKNNWRVPNQKELNIIQNSGALENSNTIWISCTASYFNMNTGAGGIYIDHKNYLLGSLNTNGTLVTVDNINVSGLRIRCVRDAF